MSTICLAMKTLQNEQQILADWDTKFQFICRTSKMDTIPFMLLTDEGEQFTVFNKCIATPFFRLEELDDEICCARLSLLEAVDMEGNPADLCEDIYSLRKTSSCIIVNLNCFCAINPLPPELVNKALPIIEPK